MPRYKLCWSKCIIEYANILLSKFSSQFLILPSVFAITFLSIGNGLQRFRFYFEVNYDFHPVVVY